MIIGYSKLIKDIERIFESGRIHASSIANTILVKTYWNVGMQIVEFEQTGRERAVYGKKLIVNLSKDLTTKYGRGFSIDNLENMRRFYITFKNSETLSRKLSWSHFCVIMRIEDKLAREFYLNEAEKEGWSVREVDRQINSMLFERLALSRDKKEILSLSKKGQIIEKSLDLIKDPYVLEFLDIKDKHNEYELEEKIINHLEKFILELGKGFSFVERQQRIVLANENFFIDLVFYNRLLKCFVIIELKIGKLTHKDLGQLQMYVNYYDREVKSQDENPTIGILLCADKKETIVKYSLPESNTHIFAAEYRLYLPNKKELQNKLRQLLG